MREILFRGKSKDNYEWIYGGFVSDGFCSAKYIVEHGTFGDLTIFNEREVISETIGQYTGRNVGADKLFEGDVIEWVEDYDDNWGDSKTYIGRSLVIWDNDNSCWAVKTDTYIQFFNDFSWDRCYVIGNIHDNPELCEVK